MLYEKPINQSISQVAKSKLKFDVLCCGTLARNIKKINLA